MTESEFNALVDDTLMQIETILDDNAETDLDYDSAGGVLTVRCENGSQIIFTRQAPVSQLWLATASGGFHFDYDAKSEAWTRDSDRQPLAEFLSETFQAQAGETLTF